MLGSRAFQRYMTCLYTGSVTPKVPHLCSPCLFTFGRGLLLHLNISQIVDSHSGIAKVPSMMYINIENKAMGLLAWHILYRMYMYTHSALIYSWGTVPKVQASKRKSIAKGRGVKRPIHTFWTGPAVSSNCFHLGVCRKMIMNFLLLATLNFWDGP